MNVCLVIFINDIVKVLVHTFKRTQLHCCNDGNVSGVFNFSDFRVMSFMWKIF